MLEHRNLVRTLERKPQLKVCVAEAMDDAYRRALDLVRRCREAIEALAQALVDRRTLEGEEVSVISVRRGL